MAYEKLKDLPFWQLCNQLPAATSAVSAFTTDERGVDPFIYGLIGTTFFRYSANGDGYQLLASPPVAAATVVSMRYTKRRGCHTRVLAATTSGITIGGLVGKILDGEQIEILQGTGSGQKKTLTFQSETVHDSGVITSTTTSNIADSTKKWKINQWAGYLVHFQYGTDATQAKRILYNDATTLYVADANLQPHNPWENQIFVATAPYALPATTAGAQTHYQIRSQTFTTDSAWTTIPDQTSFLTSTTGGIYLVSSAASAPYFTFQYYDIAADNWVTKTCPQSLILAALGTEVTIERTAKVGTAVFSSTATSATARTLVDTVRSMEVDRYRNYRLLVTGGTGAGQTRRVVCNTATTFSVARNWDITPDGTSTYELWPDFDRIYLGGNANGAIYAYSPENDYWMQGQAFDDGVCANISCTMKGWTSLGVTSGARIAAGITGINSTPTAGGTSYTLGDVLTCSVGGTGAQVIVTGIGASGAVTSIELMNAGTATGFTIGTGKATTGGTGSGCTIEITSVGVVSKITLATAHWFRTGNQIIFAGCSEAVYNAQYTILCVNSTTVFDIATTATANMAASNSQSTTLIVDASKNWIVNEHVGKLVHLMVAGTAPTSQVRWITANTATTITVATITAGTNGTSKYVIYDSKAFGAARLRKETGREGWGHATGGSTTTLIDTSKNWIFNQFAGYKMRIDAGTGLGSGVISITSNTSNTLTYTTQTFTPDATTHYEIHETWGIMSAGSTTSITEATYKNWTTNQFAGKRVRVTGGTALGQEVSITSNTGTALTVPTFTAPDATSTYCIIEPAARGAGCQLIFIFGCTDISKKQRYILFPRGAATNVIDIYDITTERFLDTSIFMQPAQEIFTTGTMWAYDGEENLWIHNLSGTVGKVLKFNCGLNKVDGALQLPGIHGTAIIGNRMEILEDSSGNDYLYIAQHTGQLMWRTPLYSI